MPDPLALCIYFYCVYLLFGFLLWLWNRGE